MADTLSSAPSRDLPSQSEPPALRPRELARWAWRQLTSMRTALVLLFLLTLAALPGSLIPQRSVDPARAAQFATQHPELAPFYERLSLFTVYSSPWFAATYLLLSLSLVGCVLPRGRQHLAALRARPPRPPRNLDRLPVHLSRTVARPPDTVLAVTRRVLRARRFRVVAGEDAVSAEKGYLRETGNLVFHAALLLLLVAMAYGRLFGYRANLTLAEGEAFSNTVSAYDVWSPGALADSNSLTPFTVAMDDLYVRFEQRGSQAGSPRQFRGRIRYTTGPRAPEQRTVLEVNQPLQINGVKVFLLGNGYAPVFSVRDKAGRLVFRGPVPFLPRDGAFNSTGVVKVPATSPQIGFEGLFLPTAVIDAQGPRSIYPGLRLPRALLTVWRGDLGIDSGIPQSVYRLQKTGMTKLRSPAGRPLVLSLAPGTSATLPGGETITLEGVRRFAALQIARDPGSGLALVASVLALAGLMASLFVRRRRVWVKVEALAPGRTLVEVAGLARTDGQGDALAEELAALVRQVEGDLEDRTGGHP